MNSLFKLIPLVALTGCASLDSIKGQFENRIGCTADKEDAISVSYWGPIGIASKVVVRDAKALCSPSPVFVVAPAPAASK